MKTKPIHFIVPLLVILSACSRKQVTSPANYDVYLQTNAAIKGLESVDADLHFWQQRLAENPGDNVSRSKIAGLLSRRFQYSGNVNELHMADSLWQVANLMNRVHGSNTFRSLAANSITMHRFMAAQQYIDTALSMGDNRYTSVLMEFDAALELGDYHRARRALNSIENKTRFEYLIREAKYKDHVEGDLDAALLLMEQAYNEVDSAADPGLYVWAKASLGDMYGHANRFKESYQCYLDALAKDPGHFHALKGIAWLAFSHDRDTKNAKRILAYLKVQHPVPDYDLMLAEIAAYEKDATAEQRYLQSFMAATRQPQYGDMYNKYIFNLETEEPARAKNSLELAQKEVAHRPTPEAFSWLARAYSANGEVEKAVETAHLYVENKSFEPEVLYHLGLIYKEKGNREKARSYLQQAGQSSFELGPVTAASIKSILSKL